MRHRNSILKKTDSKAHYVLAEVDKVAPRRPLRIEAEHVLAATEELEEAMQWHGILRGEDALVPMEPFVMMDLSLDPTFPLPEVEPVPVEVEEEEEETVDEVTAATLQRMHVEWEIRLEEEVARARNEAYEEGYEDGYVAAEAALQGSFEQRRKEVEKDITRLQEAWAAFLKKSEPLMASLAFDVARQLLDAPLPQDVRAVSAQALAQALEHFGKESPIDITIHPDDFARLQAYGLVDDIEAAHASIRWTSDESLAMGDWIVQSPEAAIRRLKEEMLTHLKSRLGLLAVMKKRES